MGAIDEGWHSFLLYTEDYASFCNEYLGEFVHHVPCLQGRPLNENHPQAFSAEDLGRMLDLVGTKLGARTLSRWMIELPNRIPQLVSKG